MTLSLVRHGETAPNREGRLLGRADPDLTAVGRTQAERLGARFAERAPGLVVSSPLLRCRETATAIAHACGLEVVVDERLVEIDYGEWDLVPLEELPEDALRALRTDPTFAPPGGESVTDVAERVGGFCAEHLDGQRSVVAVSHVSPIKAGVTWAIDADPLAAYRMRLDIASVSRIGGRAGSPVLLAFNETDHLA